MTVVLIDMGDVVHISEAMIFTYDTATKLLPLIKKITKLTWAIVTKLEERKRFLVKSGALPNTIAMVDTDILYEMNRWGGKITRLGCKVWPEGFVGFDNGYVYLSWWGENEIEYYHQRNEHPSKRQKMIVGYYVL